MKALWICIIGLVMLSSCSIFKGSGKSKKKKELEVKENQIEEVEKEVVEKPMAPPEEMLASFLKEYVNIKYKKYKFEMYLFVSVKYQNMYLIEDDAILKKYKISTAANGAGNDYGSEQTPIGLHRVKNKIGHNVPEGGLFQSRVYAGKTAKIYTDKTKSPTDDITTRIMWLEGMESGLNKGGKVDSYNRYIYIHGTSEEGLIGTPQSHGCIRMKNADIVELFSIIPEGTPVLILNY